MNYPNFENLVNIIKRLRDPEKGCPWDLKQTHESLLKYLIEESYEFIYATELQEPGQMEEEIGDVLLQVLLHCKIGEESRTFDIESVASVLSDKLTRRHPHVFENNENDIDADQVLVNWKKIKGKEKKKKPLNRINETDLIFPSLFSADKIGRKTFDLGFDWDNAGQVFEKVEEELIELKDELTKSNYESNNKVEEEIGDLLFSVAQLARHLGINSEEALRSANKKFITRFNKMEEMLENENLILENLTQKEMDVYWDKVKNDERNK